MSERDDPEGEPVSGVVLAIQRGAAAEIRRDVADVKRDVNRLENRVDSHEEHIADLRESHARIGGEVGHLVRHYERAITVTTAQVMTDLDVRKAGALAEIKERGADSDQRRAIRRELVFKAIAVVMGLWAIVSSMLATKC